MHLPDLRSRGIGWMHATKTECDTCARERGRQPGREACSLEGKALCWLCPRSLRRPARESVRIASSVSASTEGGRSRAWPLLRRQVRERRVDHAEGLLHLWRTGTNSRTLLGWSIEVHHELGDGVGKSRKFFGLHDTYSTVMYCL